MNNLETAMKKMTNKEANKIYDAVKSAYTEEDDYSDAISDLISDLARSIGGYYDGSSVYDSGDTTLMAKLFGESDDGDFSMNYDAISTLKELYASSVIAGVEESDMENLRSFEKIFNDSVANKSFAGNIEELAAAFKKSKDFADDIYEALNQPRG